MSVREIRGWTPTTPLPESPHYLRGVINLRGTTLPVVDLVARLGLRTSEPSERHAIIVAQVGDTSVGFLVDAVCDIMSMNENDMQPAPGAGPGVEHSFVRGLLTVDDRVLVIVKLEAAAIH